MGSAICWIFKKNCHRKGCGDPSGLIHVFFDGLSVPLLGWPRVSNRWGKGFLNLLRGLFLLWYLHLLKLDFCFVLGI